MLNIVLFGPPGAGKGTQSQKLIEKYNLRHLSTGDILRAAIQSNSPIGLEAKKYMDRGNLVPDEMVIDLIGKELDEHKEVDGFVFDGFPRTTVQAAELDDMLRAKGVSINLMVSLEVEYDELVKRLLGRAAVSNRTDDQDVNIIKDRIEVYNRNTLPVKDYYKNQGKYYPIDGMGTIDQIFERITRAVEKTR